MSMKVSSYLRLHASVHKQIFFLNSGTDFSLSVLVVFVETAWYRMCYYNRAVNLQRCQAGKYDCVKSGKPGFVSWCCECLNYRRLSWARKLPDVVNILR